MRNFEPHSREVPSTRLCDPRTPNVAIPASAEMAELEFGRWKSLMEAVVVVRVGGCLEEMGLDVRGVRDEETLKVARERRGMRIRRFPVRVVVLWLWRGVGDRCTPH